MCSHEEAKPNSVLQMYVGRCASNSINIVITYLKSTFNCNLNSVQQLLFETGYIQIRLQLKQ